MFPYNKLQLLGEGSYGSAFLVRTQAGVLRVAKEVNLDTADDKRRAEALREAEVLKSLAHPNIVGYHGSQLEGSRLSMVMEYVDGGDLGAAIARRRASGCRYREREAMSLFAQLALALEFLHGRRILHRDIKAANVFLATSGVAKLGDFGVARVLKAYENFAETCVGTPHNLPPEMCDGQPYDFKADVWGLGVVLYEMLALKAPFKAQNVAVLAMRICTVEPKPVPAVYSGEVQALLSSLLAKHPEDRPTSAAVASLPYLQRGCGAALRPGARAAGYPSALLSTPSGAQWSASARRERSPVRADVQQVASTRRELAPSRLLPVFAVELEPPPLLPMLQSPVPSHSSLASSAVPEEEARWKLDMGVSPEELEKLAKANAGCRLVMGVSSEELTEAMRMAFSTEGLEELAEAKAGRKLDMGVSSEELAEAMRILNASPLHRPLGTQSAWPEPGCGSSGLAARRGHGCDSWGLTASEGGHRRLQPSEGLRGARTPRSLLIRELEKDLDFCEGLDGTDGTFPPSVLAT